VLSIAFWLCLLLLVIVFVSCVLHAPLVLLCTGRIDDAQDEFNKALALNPGMYTAIYNLGTLHLCDATRSVDFLTAVCVCVPITV
jgi:hypothetical protein